MTSVLFCTSGYFPDKSGGAEHQARLQAEELTRRGHHVEVVCPRRRGTRVSQVGPIRVHRLPVIERRYLIELTYCFFLGFFLLWNLRRFRVVHIHMTHLDSVVICTLAWLTRRPVYAKIARGGQGGDSFYIARSWYLRWTALRYPARFQVISDEIAANLLSIGVARERLVNIPNGVDLRDVQLVSAEERARLRERLGLPVDRVLVLFMGRFVRMKGQDTLLEAWTQVTEPSATLVLVGRRPADGYGPGMNGEGEPPSDDRLIVQDWTDDPASYVAAVDIFVLPSRGEGMSNALLRAMAQGLAVVATPVGAAEAMIEDGVSGVIVPIGDAEALANAMQALIADGSRRKSMGAAARRRVSERYSIESVVDRIEEQYGLVLQR